MPKHTDLHSNESCVKTKSTKTDEKVEILSELVTIVKKQGEQIDSLTKMVSEHSSKPNFDRRYGDQRPNRSIICFACNKPGHVARKCPNNGHVDNKQGN